MSRVSLRMTIYLSLEKIGVTVARTGLKLLGNEALGFGKAMRCLPGLQDSIKNQK